MRTLVDQSFGLLRQRLAQLPTEIQADAQQVLQRESSVRDRFRAALERPIPALRIRCHGDYHLGQVLYTGKDFVILDFEGEPARTITERRIKRTPLRDVAGMLRSFHYAAFTALLGTGEGGLSEEATRALEPWAQYWYRWVSATYTRAYFEGLAESPIVPGGAEERNTLLEISLLEKAVYELSYELNNRPSWAHIPIRGILELTRAEG
jgi:maltose alpha-D-glucosyltransferase/alpha-amylase